MVAISLFNRNRYGWSEYSERFVFSTSLIGELNEKRKRKKRREKERKFSLSKSIIVSEWKTLSSYREINFHTWFRNIFHNRFFSSIWEKGMSREGVKFLMKLNSLHLKNLFFLLDVHLLVALVKFFNYFQSITACKSD